MIQLRGVWFRYPGSDWVLRDVDLALGKPGITVIVGPNGSGKTTLMKLASLIYRPQRGSVLVNGRDAWALGGSERLMLRRRIVYVHEKPVMLKGSVWDNIAYGLRIRGVDGEELERRVRQAASSLGIEGLLGERADKLSAGQIQLVAIARALAVEPEVLMLDEPFAHLDRAKRRTLMELLNGLKARDTRVVIATHDTFLASRIASRVIILEDGSVMEASSVEDVL